MGMLKDFSVYLCRYEPDIYNHCTETDMVGDRKVRQFDFKTFTLYDKSLKHLLIKDFLDSKKVTFESGFETFIHQLTCGSR